MVQVAQPVKRWAYPARLVAIAVAYYVVARLGLRLSLVGESVTPLWPPTGLAVFALIGSGRRMWPAIAVAAFAVNLPISPNAGVAATIAAGNTLAPLVAATLLEAVGFRPALERVKDALAIVFLAALLSMLVSATVGTTALVLSDAVARDRYLETWSVWWTGDAMGVLVVAPFLWSLRAVPREMVRLRRIAEAMFLLALLGAALAIPLRSGEPMLYLVLPVLAWIAWRFQQHLAAPAGLIAATTAVVGAANSWGPFATESLLVRMVVLQSFNAAVAFTTFFFAAAVAERLRIERERQQLVEAEREAQTRLYEREHSIAVTLQRSLLPDELVEMPGVLLAARYLPASTRTEVGGDWYDVIPLPRGRLGLVIGDVAGHGIPAAAAMGQIRMALRAYALDELAPAEAMRRLNQLLLELQPGVMSTVLYAQFDVDLCELRFANAGHPPPLLLSTEAVAYLDEGLAPPIGVSPHIAFDEGVYAVPAGSTLLLYTDGLVEERGRAIDLGLEDLRRVSLEEPGDLESLCDHVLQSLVSDTLADDVALLAMRLASLAGTDLHVRRPAIAPSVPDVRHVVGRWLTDNAAAPDEAYEISVAFGEAFTNAVRHAYGPEGGDVEVSASINDGVVELVVRDFGTWRSPLSPDETDGGRGLSLMRQFMDDVEVRSDVRGTRVALKRKLQVHE